jgi:5-formyltetrahydrofolate cyclo-ligase
VTAPAPASRGLPDRKRELRRRILDARDALPPDVRRAQSSRVATRLLELPDVRSAATIALFSSFGSEVATGPIIRALHERGASVLLPYVDGPVLAMAPHPPGGSLVTTPYGASEPAVRDSVDPAEIDVVVAPGLAFDRRGNRIGYGRGYYDAFLPTLRPETLRVGICLDVQLVDEVPHGPGDERVDLIVTPDEVVDCRPARRDDNR